MADADSKENVPPGPNCGFDKYQSVADPHLMIVVETGVVPPFRFKAGGWELLGSSIEVGPAMRTRIAERGFLLFRLNPDENSGVELTDLPSPPQNEDLR